MASTVLTLTLTLTLSLTLPPISKVRLLPCRLTQASIDKMMEMLEKGVDGVDFSRDGWSHPEYERPASEVRLEWHNGVYQGTFLGNGEPTKDLSGLCLQGLNLGR